MIFAFCASSSLQHTAGGGENGAREWCLVWRVLRGQKLGSAIPKPGQVGTVSDGRCLTEELQHGKQGRGNLGTLASL